METGPGNVLAGLVQSILKDKEHASISVDSSKGKRNGQYDLALVLAKLSSLGYQVDLKKWDSNYLAKYVQTPPTRSDDQVERCKLCQTSEERSHKAPYWNNKKANNTTNHFGKPK